MIDRNPENRVAGNADDRIKHTVYLTVLDFLLERSPWREGLSLHECHAGRGIYPVPPEDPRRQGINAILHDSPLGRAQLLALEAAGVDPGQHYAGSAALCSAVLDRDVNRHQYEAYEWDPTTRAELRRVVGSRRVLGDCADGRFDGETHIAGAMPEWGARDVVFMDPFAIWDRQSLAERRARYARIFDALERRPSRPVWVLYLTWRGERARPALTDQRRIEVSWQIGVACTMWVAPPEEHLAALASVLRRELAHGGIIENSEGRSDKLVRVDIL